MSGIVPNWLERLLGVDPVGSGEGTLWSLEHSWGWAPWITLLLVALAVAWVVYFYVREGAVAGPVYKGLLISIRLALLLLVCLMIAELMLALRRTGLPTVVVMVDDSASMGIPDRYDEKLASLAAGRVKQIKLDQPTRLNLAKSILVGNDTELLARIERKYKLKLYFFSGTAQAQSGDLAELRTAIMELQPTGDSTRLGAALRSVLADQRGTPPAAIVVLTDGINTDGESLTDAARYAWRKGVPLYTVGLGNDQPVQDLELTDLLVDDVVFVNDIIDFRFKLSGSGLVGRSVEITLREKNNSSVLAKIKAIVPAGGRSETIHLPYRPTVEGDFEYVIEVERLPEETKVDNNQLERLVSVRKDEIRVLLVQAYPNYEFRYLKNMLERDTTIKLRTVLQEADLEHAEQDDTALRLFPVRREELFEYDVILFGDVNPALLSPAIMSNINDFVEKKGGGIAFMAGPQYTPLAYRNTPLAALFPIDLATARIPAEGQALSEGFVAQPTDLGLTTPAMQLGDSAADTARIWHSLPPLYWLLETSKKPAAQVLAEHPTRFDASGNKLPVLLSQYVGAGKVLLHATDDTWRWRFRVGDAYFARYWVQAIRSLSRSKLLGKDRSALLTADPRGNSVRLRARFLDERLAPAEDDGVTIVIERAGLNNQQVILERNASSRGVFETTVGDLLQGQYHAWIAKPTLEGKSPAVDFRIVPPPGEFEQVQMDALELARAARETRGKFYRLPDIARLSKDLPPGHQVPIENLPPKVLWNQWWVMATFLGLIVTEWVLRKRKGML